MTYTHTVPGYFLYPQHPITVCVIGVGATGSQMLTKLVQINLSLIALGRPGIMVTAYDDDKITSANIGRQNFIQADVGQYKSEVLINRINRSFGFGWEGIAKRYKHPKEINRCPYNIAITCVDNVQSREDFYKPYRAKQWEPLGADRWVGQQRAVYWLDLGNGLDFGQAILGTLCHVDQPEGVENAIPMLKNIFHVYTNLKKHEKPDMPSCSAYEALGKQDLFVNTIVADWGANLLWDLLFKGRIDKQGVFVNLKNYQSNPLMIKPWQGKSETESSSTGESFSSDRIRPATLADLLEAEG